MKRMRVFCMGLACASLLTFMNVNVGAAVYDGQLQPETELHMVVARASGQFSTTIKANAKINIPRQSRGYFICGQSPLFLA